MYLFINNYTIFVFLISINNSTVLLVVQCSIVHHRHMICTSDGDESRWVDNQTVSLAERCFMIVAVQFLIV